MFCVWPRHYEKWFAYLSVCNFKQSQKTNSVGTAPKHKTVYNNQKVTFRLIPVIIASQQSVIKCLLGTETQIVRLEIISDVIKRYTMHKTVTGYILAT